MGVEPRRPLEPDPAAPLRKHVPTLDGWRAVAVGAVIASHAVRGYTLSPRTLALTTTLGAVGVAIFFGISGLIITYRLLAESAEHGTISLRNFYLRRVWRIMPAAYLYLVVVVALGLAGWLQFSAFGTLASALYFRNYAGGAPWELAHYWSLAVEEHFYLLWPTLLAYLGVRRARRAAWGLALAVLIWRAIAIHLLHLNQGEKFWGHTDICFDALLYGCLAAIALSSATGRVRWHQRLRAPAWWALGLLAAVFTLRSAPLPAIAATVQAGIIPLLLLGTVLHTNWIGSRCLEARGVAWIGRISYSLYLWQELFLGPGHSSWMGLRIAVIFACAAASYYGVERPIVAWAHGRWPGAADGTPRAAATASA